jgi:hypothetical protein
VSAFLSQSATNGVDRVDPAGRRVIASRKEVLLIASLLSEWELPLGAVNDGSTRAYSLAIPVMVLLLCGQNPMTARSSRRGCGGLI